jgi:hypothetical protein
MKLTKILESIIGELNKPKPEDAYPFDNIKVKDLGYGDYYAYSYTNVKGDPMEVTVLKTKLSTDPGPTLYVAFGIQDPKDNSDSDDSGYESQEAEDEAEEKKYKSKTGANDMIKVMATVVEAINQTAKKIGGMDKVYAITYNPSDKKRKNVYDHYIQSLFPNFEKDLKSASSSFTKFINKVFKNEQPKK